MRGADAGLFVVCLAALTTCDQAPGPLQPRLSLVPPPLASVAPDPTSETISLTVTDTAYGSMGFDVYTMNRSIDPLDPADPGAEGEKFKLPGGWDLNTQKMQDLDTRRKTWGQVCGWK